MTINSKERAGWDVWDKLRHGMSKAAAVKPKQPERPWYHHPKAPMPGDTSHLPPAKPREKPRTGPPMPPNKGDQKWWQDKRVPSVWQNQTEKSKRK